MIKTCKDRCQDTYQPPLRLGAGRLCGLLADAGLSGCRIGKEEERRRRGDGLPGMDGAGNGPAAICGGNSEVFNRPLTTFLVVAMVWRLAVFILCSYCLFWRRLGRLRFPGAWAVVGGLRGGLGLLAVGSGNGRGSGKRDGASQDGGRVLPHILPSPPRTLG